MDLKWSENGDERRLYHMIRVKFNGGKAWVMGLKWSEKGDDRRLYDGFVKKVKEDGLEDMTMIFEERI